MVNNPFAKEEIESDDLMDPIEPIPEVETINTNEELMKDTIPAINAPIITINVPIIVERDKFPKERIIRDIIPASVHDRITAAARGRLESDIPMNDPYWITKS